MAFLRLIARRLFAQRLLAVALLIAMAFTIGVLVAGPIYVDGSARAIVAGTVAQSFVSDRNVRYTVQIGARYEQGVADRAVRSAVRSLPVQQVIVEAGTPTLSIQSKRGPTWGDQLAFRDGEFGHLLFSEGRAPVGDGEAGMSTGDAFTFNVEVGDRLRLSAAGGRKADVTVTGLYLLPNGDDPFWFGAMSPFVTRSQAGLPLPLIVAPDSYRSLTNLLQVSTGTAVWDVYLDLHESTTLGLRSAYNRAHRILEQLRQQPGLSYMSEQTGLLGVVRTAEQRVGSASAPIYLVVFQIAAVALAVLAGVASLVLSRQSFELAVLKSRGFSRRQLLLAQGIQSALAAAGALPIGLVVGWVLARMARAAHGPFLPGTPFPLHMKAPAVAIGVVGALAGAAAFVLTSLPHVLRTVIEERHHVSRESRPLLARYPLELVAGALGALTFWEVKRRGLGPSLRHGGIDPFTLLAPTLLLFAASFAVLRLLLWTFRRLDGLVARTRRLAVYLAGRRLGRAPSASFATALLLLLATGLLVVSSSYRATILTNHADVAHQQVGADWALQTGTDEQSLALIRRLPDGTTALFRGPVDSIDSTELAAASVDVAAAGSNLAQSQVVAIDPTTYARGAWWRSDYSDRPLSDLLASIQSSASSTRLPAGARDVALEVDAGPRAAGMKLVAVIERPGATVATLGLGTLVRGPGSYPVAAPGGSRLLSIDLEKADQPFAPPRIGFTIGDLHGVTGSGPFRVSLRDWGPLRWQGSGGTVGPDGQGIRALLNPGGGHAVAGVVPPQPDLPAIASNQLAPLAGRTVSTNVCGITVRIRFDAFVQRFPGLAPDAPFVVLSAPALLQRMISVPLPCGGVNEIRAMGAASPAPALRHLGLVVVGVGSAVAVEASLAQDPQSLALGMHFAAAAGGMGLVVIGLAVSLYFGQRRRQFEFAALRALGTEHGQLVGALVGEQAFLVGFALIGALGLGLALLRLIMPYAARNLTTSIPPGLLRVDWVAIAVFGAAVVGVVCAAIALGVRALFGTSVPAVLRGEAE